MFSETFEMIRQHQWQALWVAIGGWIVKKGVELMGKIMGRYCYLEVANLKAGLKAELVEEISEAVIKKLKKKNNERK